MPRTARRARTPRARAANEPVPDLRSARSPLEREQARVDSARTTADLREAQRIRVEQTGNRPFAGASLGSHGQPAGKPTGKRFVILHHAVDEHTQGSVVHESQFRDGVDFDRLISLGAIRPHTDAEQREEDERAAPASLLDMDYAPEPTLTEAAFSDSPPTLPRLEGIDTTHEEMHAALREGVATSGPREDTLVDPHEPSPRSQEGEQ